MRFTVPGEFESLTLAAWVRADSLPNQNNSLMMADGWDPGAPHWQIGKDGAVILGIRGPLDYNPEPKRPRRSIQGARGDDAGTARSLGSFGGGLRPRRRRSYSLRRWPTRRAGAILFDIPLRIGDAVIGNWNVASYRVKTPVRNFNGCIDEFALFSRALTGPEIERLYSEGQPR